MTRNGKIARLSAELREELNERLDEGAQGKELVAWLNSLPEVQNEIRYSFRGQPISEQNLSQWRNGGYREWQEKGERWHMLHSLQEEAAQMGFAVDPEETQRHLSVMLTLELGRALRDLIENTADVKERVKGLDRLIGRFAQLRREESHARKVDMEWKLRRRELGSYEGSGFGLESALRDLGGEEEVAGGAFTEATNDDKSKVQPPTSNCGATRSPSSYAKDSADAKAVADRSEDGKSKGETSAKKTESSKRKSRPAKRRKVRDLKSIKVDNSGDAKSKAQSPRSNGAGCSRIGHGEGGKIVHPAMAGLRPHQGGRGPRDRGRGALVDSAEVVAGVPEQPSQPDPSESLNPITPDHSRRVTDEERSKLQRLNERPEGEKAPRGAVDGDMAGGDGEVLNQTENPDQNKSN